MRRILVTGANKGIGLAIAEAILTQHDDTFVLLGSRDLERGRAAAAKLPHTAERVEVVTIDVGSDESVAEAKTALNSRALYGIVNNAGVGSESDFASIVDTNALGVHRVCATFRPLLEDGGRIVNVTSASGPTFVSKCNAEWQRFFLDGSIAWPRLKTFIEECLATKGDEKALTAKGLDTNAYGLSKACANLYTLILAREQPGLRINACTPGFIATDLTKPYATSAGKSPEEMGMKPPSEGARAPMHLLFGSLEGNGRYYGSDAKRSPLDRYRAPGSPEYTE